MLAWAALNVLLRDKTPEPEVVPNQQIVIAVTKLVVEISIDASDSGCRGFRNTPRERLEHGGNHFVHRKAQVVPCDNARVLPEPFPQGWFELDVPEILDKQGGSLWTPPVLPPKTIDKFELAVLCDETVKGREAAVRADRSDSP